MGKSKREIRVQAYSICGQNREMYAFGTFCKRNGKDYDRPTKQLRKTL